VNVEVEVLDKVTGEILEAVNRLLPQLSSSARPLDDAALAAVADIPTNIVLLARRDGVITGMLTLVLSPMLTGLRAVIEDVVVDESARRQGVGEALSLAALRLARDAGARTVDLTSRPSRVAAGRLYQRLGFQLRDTRVYRYTCR
jgi:ribosomal protein S18 acetylase RimI-like enzyme